MRPRRRASRIDVYVEVDVGGHRCGVAPGTAVGELARRIATRQGPALRGPALLPGRRAAPARAARSGAPRSTPRRAPRSSRATRARRAAWPSTTITGAGTGTFEFEIASGAWTELQPGSYPFMDADYARNAHAPGAMRFAQSLFVLSTVMSTPAPSRAICDAGLKAFAFDSGLPQVAGRDGLTYVKASDEHGVLECGADAARRCGANACALVPGPLRPHGQPLRLARRHARRSRRGGVARRARHDGLKRARPRGIVAARG